MSMLDLPNELFEPIIRHLVKREDGIIECAKYRRVCKAFAVSVEKGIQERATRMRFFDFLAIPQHVEYFGIHGEHILYEKAMQGVDTSCAIVIIQSIVDIAVGHNGPYFKANRTTFLSKVCRLMMAVQPSTLRQIWHLDRQGQPLTWDNFAPAIAAAVNDLTTLRPLITTLNEILSSPYTFLPSPVIAATVTSQKGTLKWLLDGIVRCPGIVQSDKELVIAAVKLAIRTHSNAAGHMLFDTLNKLVTIKPSNETLGGSLFMYALKYDNEELVCRTLDLQDIRVTIPPTDSFCTVLNVRHVRSTELEIDSPANHKLDKKTLGRLFGLGSSKILTKLIEEGWIQIDGDYNDRTLLAYALRCRRYDLAETILQHGANINACSRVEGCTALSHAVRDYYYNDVLFLLKHGADPVPNRSGWRPHEFTSNKMVWLLRLRDSGNGRTLLKKSNEEIYKEYEQLVKNNFAGFHF